MSLFGDFVANLTPKMNQEVAEGFCYHRIENALEHIVNHTHYNCLEKSRTHLRFKGARVLDPDEVFHERYRKRTNVPYDLAKNTFYLAELAFEYGDGIFEANLLVNVPYMDKGNILYALGRKILLMPTITNKVISVGELGIFVSVGTTKYNVYRLNYQIREDNSQRNFSVIHSPQYINPSKRLPDTTRAKTTLLHYLLCFYGYEGAMMRVLGFVPEVTMNEVTDPNMVVFESMGDKPRSWLGDAADYPKNDIKFVVPRDKNEPTLTYVLGNLIYILDHFPKRIPISQFNDTRTWRRYLGEIIFSGEHGIPWLIEKIDKHCPGLLDEFDVKVKNNLLDRSHPKGDLSGGEKIKPVTNQIELLELIFKKFNDWMVEGGDKNIFYNKTLEAESFILGPTTHNITTLLLEIIREERKNDGNPLDVKTVSNIFRSAGLLNNNIYKLRSERVFASGIEDPTDHLYLKRTVRVVNQESDSVNVEAGGSNTATRNRISSEAAQVGSILNLPKKNPNPLTRLNPYINLEPVTYTIIPHPDLVEVGKKTDVLLSLTSFQTNITDSNETVALLDEDDVLDEDDDLDDDSFDGTEVDDGDYGE